jgi:CheY-like chemotaxis protein
MDMTDSRPDNIRVLVVEDESLVAMMLEDMLDTIGYQVAGVASNIEQAQQTIVDAAFDVVLLDVNLKGALSFGIAEKLRAMGVPFVLSTGYGQMGVPAAYRDAPIIAKPFRVADLQQALEAALKPMGSA